MCILDLKGHALATGIISPTSNYTAPATILPRMISQQTLAHRSVSHKPRPVLTPSPGQCKLCFHPASPPAFWPLASHPRITAFPLPAISARAYSGPMVKAMAANSAFVGEYVPRPKTFHANK